MRDPAGRERQGESAELLGECLLRLNIDHLYTVASDGPVGWLDTTGERPQGAESADNRRPLNLIRVTPAEEVEA
ncbi:hypothetical protein GCM10023198_15060 [Promicromonospora umidemergens]|uniref:Uncharacterized protein n=1 Tax=Promicromonospora umidemergens TaxID=629679 RepID=A0ABP8WWC2_9MICO